MEAFYQWKEVYFKTTNTQRNELNQALGELAKKSLEQESSKFRLTKSFICEVLGESDEGLFKLALDLGWLNRVGVAEENPSEQVYAFFHPSFQEYFASLAIDDWRFLFNHNPQELNKENYKVFDTSWHETIMLWISRKTILTQEKEIFINYLIDFDDDCEAYYSIQAFFLAAKLIGEAPDIKNSLKEHIISTILEWGFGEWDDECQKWLISIDSTQEKAKGILSLTFKEEITRYLLFCISKSSSNLAKFEAVEQLAKIDPKNRKCLDIVVEEFNLNDNTDFDCEIFFNAFSLAKSISFYQPELIDLLLSKLNSMTENIENIDQIYLMSNCIAHIDPGNTKATKILINTLQKYSSDKNKVSELAASILMIDHNSEFAVSTLLNLLINNETKTIKNYVTSEISEWVNKDNQELIDLICCSLNTNLDRLDPLDVGEIFACIKKYDISRFKMLEELIITSKDKLVIRYAMYVISNILEIENINYDPNNIIKNEIKRHFLENIKNIKTKTENNYYIFSMGKLIKSVIDNDFCEDLENLISQISHSKALYSICEIILDFEPNNVTATSCLIKLLSDCNDSDVHWNATSLLMDTIPVEQLLSLVLHLKRNWKNLDSQEIQWKFVHYEETICRCSENITYPQFYEIWHNTLKTNHPEVHEIYPLGNIAIAQTLNQQILDLPSQLQPTKKTYPLIINAKSLEKMTSENSLSQSLCNKIYKIIFPQITDIPKVNDPSDLEREIIKIKGQIQKQNLVLIFHKGEPKETLVNVCEQLTDEIYYKFITNEPIEHGFSLQKNPENPVEKLQNWINQLD